jgi:hypothetical protein
MTRTIAAIAVALSMSCAEATADEAVLYEFFSPYGQRVEGVTRDAGNARDVNAATHVIDPWPRHVGNRRIPANGERMTGAVTRYRDVRRLPLTPAPIAPTPIGVAGPSGAGTGTSAASGPAAQ